MEKAKEHSYLCKLCSKSFPCGRSLGGHMKSHIINSSDNQNPQTSSKTNLKSVNDISLDQMPNYTLRENPKKTCRFVDSNEKLCRHCGRVFHSWKSLFGHMKCHSNKFSNNEDFNSLIGDINGIKAPSKKRKRSSRGKARSKVSIDSDFDSPVSEIEQEQEEVAMCLIMLSRDLGNTKRGFCSVPESSNNNSKILEVGSSIISSEIVETTKGKGSLSNAIFKKLSNGELDSTISGDSRFDLVKKLDFWSNLKFGVSKLKDELKASEVEMGNNLSNKLQNLSGKFSSRNWDFKMRKEEALEKKTEFECTICNKTFHSYQALGGHRASHKKIKNYLASKIENCENGVESKPLKEKSIFLEPEKTTISPKDKKIKAHFECPICFKVFSSGQALGGHKRSHLTIGSDTKNNNSTSIVQNPIREVRYFFDLNLPASIEGGGESSPNGNESFLGLISRYS